MSWINKIYHFIWANILHLDKPISWLVVDSIKAHLLLWDLIGSLALVIIWILAMHFITMN